MYLNCDEPILKLKENKQGRDFIVGDIHGCYNALKKLIKEVRFIPNVDRLISVGDLIDRGPQSFECLDLLKRPWFFSVRGNHEQMLIDYFYNIYKNNPYDSKWIKNIGDNYSSLKKFYRQYILQLNQLPYVIKIDNSTNPDYIVHAELVDKNIIQKDNIDNWNLSDQEQVKYNALWGRCVYDNYLSEKPFNYNNLHGSNIYSGHTILDSPFKIGNQIFLDKGAFVPYFRPLKFSLNKNKKIAINHQIFKPGLVMVEPKTKKCWCYYTASQEIVSFYYD